jgi:hypothetical protein
MVIAKRKSGDSGVRRNLLPGQRVRLTSQDLNGALGAVVALRRPWRVVIRLEHGVYVEVGREQVEAVKRRW